MNSGKKSNKELERQMLPRLKFMGTLLIFFGFCSFLYGMTLDPPSPIDTPEEKQLSSGLTLLNEDGRINAYGIAGIFAVVGSGCIVIALKRKDA